MRNNFVYSGSIKIHASGFDKLLESIFCILLVVEAFSLPKVVNMFEEVMVRGQVNVEEEAKLYSPILSTFEDWMCDIWSGVVLEKNWALSVDQ